MEIVKELKQVLEKENQLIQIEDSNNLKTFYEDAKNSGLIIQTYYDIPPVDTLGIRLYEYRSCKVETPSPL